MKFKLPLKSIVIFSFLSVWPLFGSYAGDKIGNGGGLWVCSSPQKEPLFAELVDLFEARVHEKLSLFALNEQKSVIQNVGNLAEDFRKGIPELSEVWGLSLQVVLNRMNLVEAELEKINDVDNLIRPLPSSCKGNWDYVQFANFTNNGELLIRKDFWEDSTLHQLSKVGLLFHEAIYFWLRETKQDPSSVRTRKIVGVLLSTLPMAEKRQRILKTLDTQPDNKPPEQEKPLPRSYICSIDNRKARMVYLAENSSKLTAEARVKNICLEGPFSWECETTETLCDDIGKVGSSKCKIQNGVSSKVFLSDGRSRLEATAKAKNACYQDSFAWSCEEAQVVCESL